VSRKWANQAFEYINLFKYDYVELCFDPHNRKQQFKDTTVRELQIAADGTWQGNVIDVERREQRGWCDECRVAVRAHGTLNEHGDQDSCYVVEAAVPWSALGIVPRNGMRIGFDLFNGDMEIRVPDYKGAFCTFGGAHTCNNDNPSEWATLVLSVGGAPAWLVWAVVIVLAAGIVVVAYVGRVKPAATEKEVAHPKIRAALAYLGEHYVDQELTVGVVAREVGLHEVYFGSLFRQQVGESFNAYVNRLRVGKARELLESDPRVKVTDAAFRSGFGTVDHFRRVFKKTYGKNPGELGGKH
jgi:AraC-like DNA-binding protein